MNFRQLRTEAPGILLPILYNAKYYIIFIFASQRVINCIWQCESEKEDPNIVQSWELTAEDRDCVCVRVVLRMHKKCYIWNMVPVGFSVDSNPINLFYWRLSVACTMKSIYSFEINLRAVVIDLHKLTTQWTPTVRPAMELKFQLHLTNRLSIAATLLHRTLTFNIECAFIYWMLGKLIRVKHLTRQISSHFNLLSKCMCCCRVDPFKFITVIVCLFTICVCDLHSKTK